MNHHIICALDTSDLNEAVSTVGRLKDRISAYKVGHALTLSHGLDVVDRLRDAGASRIFLDLKFHDIPNSVALAVRESARRGVWMMTVHITGGPAMLAAAVEEARAYPEESRPLIVGVSVLTSLDQGILNGFLGVPRDLEEHMVALSAQAVETDLDGVVCSPHEIRAIRHAVGPSAVIVTPGIRIASGETHDQKRFGTPKQALADGASYLVIGRALTSSPDIERTLDTLWEA